MISSKRGKGAGMHLSKEKYRHLYAFIFSALIAVVSFAIAGVLPGQQYVNVSFDAFTQEAAFSKMLTRHLFDGANMFYSNEVSLGQNTSFVYAMYGYSPFSILYALPLDTYTVMVLGNILKIGFAAAFFELFLRKGMRMRHMSTVLWGASYALSAFHIFFQQSANFDEGVYLFPLVMWMLMEFVHSGRKAGLCLSYALSFVADFYCGYIIGLGSFSALAIFLILKDGRFFVRNNRKLLVSYIRIVLSAVAISMLVLLPALCFYYENMRGGFNGTLYTKDSLPVLLSGFYWGTEDSVMNNSCSLYAGIMAVVLLPMYFINPKICRRERGAMGIALLSLIPAYYFEPVYLLLHAFNPPTGFPMRYAYVYVFMILFLAARQYICFGTELLFFENLKNKLIYVVIQAVVMVCVLLLAHKTELRRILLNFGLIAVWGGFMWERGRFSKSKKGVIVAVILFLELAGNTAQVVPEGMQRELYSYLSEEEKHAAEWIQEEQKDGQLYRARICNAISPNTQSERGYNGVGVFSTSIYPALHQFMLHMGDNANGYVYFMQGNTDFLDMLLGVRYQVRLDDPENVYGHSTDYRYINDRALPIGFMVSSDLLTMDDLEGNPFKNQNRIATAMMGESMELYAKAELADIQNYNMGAEYREDESISFWRISEEDIGKLALLIPANGHERAYFQLSNVEGGRQLTEHAKKDDEGLFSLYSERDRMSNGCRDAGMFNPGKGVMEMDAEEDWFYMLLMSEQGIGGKTDFAHLYLYYQEDAVLNRIYNELAALGWKIQDSDSLHIRARVTGTDKRPLLFLSIPYDSGWHCLVDGAEQEVKAVMDGTFSAVELSPGEHEILLQYQVQGLYAGVLLFIAGTISVIGMWMETHKRSSRIADK